MVEVHPSDDPGFALTVDQELLVAGDQRALAPILPGHREPGLAEARVVGQGLGGHTELNRGGVTFTVSCLDDQAQIA